MCIRDRRLRQRCPRPRGGALRTKCDCTWPPRPLRPPDLSGPQLDVSGCLVSPRARPPPPLPPSHPVPPGQLASEEQGQGLA
eukprot:9494114-Pyramimonas_sp.AAC.2